MPSRPARAATGADRACCGRVSLFTAPGSEAEQRRDRQVACPAEAADLLELLDAAERTVLGPVVHPALCQRRTDSGQLFEVFDARRVQAHRLDLSRARPQ